MSFRRPPAAPVKAVVAWTPAVLCGLWAAVRLLGFEIGFPVPPLLAYTPYVVPVAIAATALAAVLREWWAAAAAGVAALVLVALIAPRVVGDGDDVEGEPLRVMAANVLRGSGDAEQLLAIARERGVEVLAVQEATPRFVSAFDAAGARSVLPHRALFPQRDVTGSAVYSVFPVRPRGPGGLNFLQARALVSGPGGVDLDVSSVHPRPPTGFGHVKPWRVGMDALPRAGEPGTQLLLGDFNATLDNPELREILDGGYADAAERMGDGLQMTWPAADKPFYFLPVAIDHLLYEDGELGVRDYAVLELEGSDHRPVYAELVIRD